MFVRELYYWGEEHPDGVFNGYGSFSYCNEISLEGFLCKVPVRRTSPLGREICDLMLAVNRQYNKSDYIPAIAWAATLSTLQHSQWERRSLQKDGCKAGNTENTAMTGSQRSEPPTKSPSEGWRGWSRQNQAGVTLCRIPIWMYHFKIRAIFYPENVLLY